MKQRVLIASALLHDPDTLILDEPLSGMDVTTAQLFKHLLDELAAHGKTILYIFSHHWWRFLRNWWRSATSTPPRATSPRPNQTGA